MKRFSASVRQSLLVAANVLVLFAGSLCGQLPTGKDPGKDQVVHAKITADSKPIPWKLGNLAKTLTVTTDKKGQHQVAYHDDYADNDNKPAVVWYFTTNRTYPDSDTGKVLALRDLDKVTTVELIPEQGAVQTVFFRFQLGKHLGKDRGFEVKGTVNLEGVKGSDKIKEARIKRAE